MRNKLLLKTGKMLMRFNKLRICIVDDEAAYFTPEMLSLASTVGFTHIERYYRVNKDLLNKLLQFPPDIVILDIKGVVDSDVAKDGFGIAKVLYEQTAAYVVITSAHKFHLHEYHQKYDYVLENRLLTAVDFIDELRKIIERYLSEKLRFYRKILYRIGYSFAKKSIMPRPG